MDGLMKEKGFLFHDLYFHQHSEVYEPAEDTFLLAESIPDVEGRSVLEIGCGSGVISLECARKGAFVMACDVNPHAVELTKVNFDENRDRIDGLVEVFRSDCGKACKDGLFDCIVCNPPYLPTREDQRVEGWLNEAFDGGEDGLRCTREVLSESKRLLKKNGRLFIIMSSRSPIDGWKNIMISGGWGGSVFNYATFDDEQVAVWELRLIS